MKPRNEIKPGDWFSFTYGFNEISFCVLAVSDEGLLMCPATWMESSATHFRFDFLESQKAAYLGRGKKRWWRPLTLIFYSVVHPYSLPVQP